MQKIAPSYYANQGNPWYVGDFILDLGLDFFLGSAVKYLFRYKNKNGKEDLVKMLSYLDRLCTLRQEHDILTIPSAVVWLSERDREMIDAFSVEFGLTPTERLLLNLICQYSKTGHIAVLIESVSVTQQLIDQVTKEEVLHGTV
jgi:hypothetical protein